MKKDGEVSIEFEFRKLSALNETLGKILYQLPQVRWPEGLLARLDKVKGKY